MDNNHLSPFYNLLCIIKCERFFDQSINSNFSEKISWTIPIQILLCNLRVCFHYIVRGVLICRKNRYDCSLDDVET